MRSIVTQGLGVLALVAIGGGGYAWQYMRPASDIVPVLVPPPPMMPLAPTAAPQIPFPVVAPRPVQPVMPAYQPAPIRTVSYFMAHPGDRKAKLAACRENPGLSQGDPECPNAARAKQHVDFSAVINSIPN